MSAKRKPPRENLAIIQAGQNLLRAHPLFSYLCDYGTIDYPDNFPQDGFARITIKNYHGKTPVITIELNSWQKASAGEWAYVLAQCYLHIAFNHIDPVRTDEPWRFACELIAVDWLNQISIGQPIYPITSQLPAQDPEIGRAHV